MPEIQNMADAAGFFHGGAGGLTYVPFSAQQHGRIDIALEGYAGAQSTPRLRQINKPVHTENFGSIDVLCSDKTGTITTGNMVLDRSLDPFGQSSPRALALGYLNSKFETGVRSPLDTAILQWGSPEAEAAGYEKRDEIPFDFERRRLSIVVERGGERLLITKGSPEGIFPLLSG